MKTVEVIETFDGVQHRSVDDANSHLDTLLDKEITPLAHKLAAPIKYTEIRNILEASTEAMRQIIRIADDRRHFH